MRFDAAVWCLAVAETIVWAGLFYIFAALFPRVEAEFGWSKVELSGAFTLAIAMSAVSSPIAGRLIDNGFGPRLLTGCAFCGGVLVGLLGLVESLGTFYVLWAGIGIAMGGCLYEPCFAFVTRRQGIDAKRTITKIALAAGFAGTISFPAAHLIAEASDWRHACGFFAVLVCGVAAPLLHIGSHRLEGSGATADTQPGDGHRQTSRGLLRRAEFWLLAGGFSAFALNHGILLNHILPILHERGLDAGTAVFAASAIGPMQVAGRLVMMAAERHATNTAVTVACFIAVLIAALLLIGAAAVPALVMGFVVLQGSGYGVTSVMRPVVTRDIIGEANFGAIAGALAVPYLASVAAAPFLGALLWQAGGYDLAIAAAFAAAAGGLVCYLRAHALAKRRPTGRPEGGLP